MLRDIADVESLSIPANTSMDTLKTFNPRCPNDLFDLPLIEHNGNMRGVRRIADHLVKYAALSDLSSEIRTLKFLDGMLSFRTPRVALHHPLTAPGRVQDATPLTPLDAPPGAWWFCMDECPGVGLDTVIENMAPSELDHIADQLSTLLSEMAAFRSDTVGPIGGGPFNNMFFPAPYFTPTHAFRNTGEFLDHIRWMLGHVLADFHIDDILAPLSREGPIRFSHADLLPRNILVQGSTITAIVDWEAAGFYPDYWEYCRMHDPHYKSPQWDHVLSRVFPGERRQDQIDAVRQIMDQVAHNF